jgi:AraC-like DNA-binding protein
MSRNPDDLLTYRSLYESPLVSLRDYVCRACKGGATAEEQCCGNNIVLMRHGAFCKHFGRRTVTADVNQSVFFSKGSSYRVSHPAECGDRGTVFVASPRVLCDIIRELDPSVDDRPDRPFPFVTGPCDSAVFWRHRQIVQRLEAADIAPLEPLWADVTALQLIADVLDAALAQNGQPRRRYRNGTDTDHAERTEAVKAYIASRLFERITLDGIARAVHKSPFHLTRVFQARTGMPIHRYLTRLRLRASLERLSNGTSDLTALALELGFSSHSHFTDTFRREFGCSPSAVRRHAGRNWLGETSKILEV